MIPGPPGYPTNGPHPKIVGMQTIPVEYFGAPGIHVLGVLSAVVCYSL